MGNKNQDDPMPDPDVAETDRRSERGRRRSGTERRKTVIPVVSERRQGERRQGERRRQIDPTTCERDYDAEECEFMQAIEQYKRQFGRPFPTWSEVLEVLKSLGYRKVAEPSVIPMQRSRAPKSVPEEE